MVLVDICMNFGIFDSILKVFMQINRETKYRMNLDEKCCKVIEKKNCKLFTFIIQNDAPTFQANFHNFPNVFRTVDSIVQS